MANNEYVNRVDFGNETLIDISDTTAEPEDVIEGQVFYTKSGAQAMGTLGDATTTTHGLMSATDKVKLDEIDSKKAPIIIDSKSGNPIVVNDGIPGLKIYDMKVSFTPKQTGSGNPSPDNIRPITGWEGINIYHTGKNMFHLNENEMISDGWNRYFPNPITKPGTYIFSCENQFGGEETKGAAVCFKDSPLNSADQIGDMMINQYAFGRTIYSSTVTITEEQANATYIAFYCNSSNASAESFLNANFQLEIGTTKTNYESYIGESHSISWQTEAGIVYGGMLDVTTGVLTITHAVASASKSIFGASFSPGIGYRQTPARYDLCLSGTDWNKARQTQIMSNGKIANPYSETTYGDYIGVVYQIEPTETKATLRISEALYQTLGDEDIVSISYELQTPYTVQLTTSQIALLIGINTVWTDADSMEIAYPIDTKKYVDAGSSNVKDVQLNGTSIISSGIANIPFASSSTPGVVKTNYSNGITINSNGELALRRATGNTIKTANDAYAVVTAYFQHESVFYGLAAAAGDVTQSSSNNTVGTYTTDAKNAIQTMLGVISLPSVTSADEGKVLRVVNGEWSAVSLPSVSEVSW